MAKSKELKYDKVYKVYGNLKEDLIKSIKYLSKEEINLLIKACDFAYKAHYGQFRISGEPYIIHPISVAKELSKWEVDVETLQAGLLHDVLEDTGSTKDDLRKIFGNNIAEIVDGLSKLEKLDNNYIDHKAANFQKMILAMIKDLRVLVIKLADRLHNMRTLDCLRSDKRVRISKETMDIYVLLANRVGMERVFRELQDLSFKYMKPNRYRILKQETNKLLPTRKIIIDKIIQELLHQFFLFNIEAKIKLIERNIYSIYSDLSIKKYKFIEIMNVYNFVIILNSVQDCYRALGSVHSLYNPKPGKFEDFIAIPRSNGHQCLKTILINNIGNNIEVNLMTNEMYKISTLGIVVSWLNKNKFNNKQDIIQNSKDEWFKNLMYIKSNSDNAIDFFENVKSDLIPREVYIFTPQGNIIVLPNGSTPVDFAYAIHTDIGNRCIGAKVDNVLVPLRYKLSSGQKVEILIDENSNPNPSWMTFIASVKAKNAIRNKIKDMGRQDAINLGEKLLNQVLDSLLLDGIILNDDDKIDYLFRLYGSKTFDEILYDIGIGRLLPVTVAMKIFELAEKDFGNNCLKLKPILISGKDKSNINLASCCNPIPGDKVKSLIIKGQGLVIHREDCVNLLKNSSNNIFDVDLDCIDNDRFYNVKLKIYSKDYKGLFFQIISCITLHNDNIIMFERISDKKSGFEGFVEFLFEIQTKGGLNKLNKIIKLIESIPSVKEVTRL